MIVNSKKLGLYPLHDTSCYICLGFDELLEFSELDDTVSSIGASAQEVIIRMCRNVPGLNRGRDED